MTPDKAALMALAEEAETLRASLESEKRVVKGLLDTLHAERATHGRILSALLGENERKVVGVLGSYDDFGYFGFAAVARIAEITRQEVIEAFKVLKAANLVVFAKGLTTDDGKMAGSGYALNADGLTVKGNLEDWGLAAALRARAGADQ